MSIRLASLVSVASLGLALAAGCSSSSDTPAGTSGTSGTSGQPATTGTTLRGAITGGAESGILDLNVPGASATTTKTLTPLADPASNAVTGAITLTGTGGKMITLTGTYDAVSGNFTVMGEGYTLTGNLKDGVATGTYTGPKGAGSFTANATSAGAVTVYCGTFTTMDAMGNWIVACTAAGACSGSYYGTTKPGGGTVTGTLAGSTITLNDEKGGTSTGTLSGTAINGQCPNGCTFQGSVAACTM
jgi:hypothetical protein